MARRRRPIRAPEGPLEAYRRVRKPMPPPERVLPDQRERAARREAEREAREAVAERQAGPGAERATRGAGSGEGGGSRAGEAAGGGDGMFADREDAGQKLAEALTHLRGQDVVVLGIPRGGVEVAAVVASALGAPLDVVIPRKLGAPGNPELGLGAVAEGVEVLDRRLIDLLGVDQDYLGREIAAQQEEIRRRASVYREGRPPLDLTGKVAVVVDDGVATGGTAVAAVRWARARGAARVVLAVPVAPPDAVRRLEKEADEVRVLAQPEPFFAVGQWYASFPQVSDRRVVELLAGRAVAGG